MPRVGKTMDRKRNARRAAEAAKPETLQERHNREDAEVERLLKLPYVRCIIPDDTGLFSASMPEFPGCFSQGDTAENAYDNLHDAAEAWLLACMETGRSIPAPIAAVNEFVIAVKP